jgi:hypothetical protein
MFWRRREGGWEVCGHARAMQSRIARLDPTNGTRNPQKDSLSFRLKGWWGWGWDGWMGWDGWAGWAGWDGQVLADAAETQTQGESVQGRLFQTPPKRIYASTNPM